MKLLFFCLITIALVSSCFGANDNDNDNDNGNNTFLNLPVHHHHAPRNARRSLNVGFNDGNAKYGYFAYFVELQVGDQSFKAILDTGSGTLAVPVTGCEYYSSGGEELLGGCNTQATTPEDEYYQPGATALRVTCGWTANYPIGCHWYDQCKHAPSNQTCIYNITYGNPSVSMHGNMMSDIVTIGGISGRAMFMATTVEKTYSPNAILGLAYNSPYMQNYFIGDKVPKKVGAALPTALDKILAANGLSNSFSLLTYHVGEDSLGQLTLGGIDPSLFIPPMYFTHLQKPYSFYHVKFGGFFLGATKYIGYKQSHDVFLDCGASVIALPSRAFPYFRDSFLAKYPGIPGNLPSNDTNSVWSSNPTFTKSEIDQWPNITFKVNGLYVTLQPHNYFVNFDRGQPNTYSFGIVERVTSVRLVLGVPFTQGLYVNYNREKNRIGFARGVPQKFASPTISQFPPKH